MPVVVRSKPWQPRPPWPAAIPLRIFMSYRTHGVPLYVLKNWHVLNPAFSVELYNDTECHAFVEEHYGSNLANIYGKIPSGPIRSDLWRVLILYSFGGVYVDVDAEPLAPLHEFVTPDDSFVTSVGRMASFYRQSVNPHLIIAQSGEEILNATLKYMLAAIQGAGVAWQGSKSFQSWSVCPAMFRALNQTFPNYVKTAGTLRKHAAQYRFLLETRASPRGFPEKITVDDRSRILLYNKRNLSVWSMSANGRFWGGFA